MCNEVEVEVTDVMTSPMWCLKQEDSLHLKQLYSELQQLMDAVGDLVRMTS